MHVLQGTKELIHDVGFVDVLQDVCPYDSMQVCFHVIKDQVNVFVILGLEHILKSAKIIESFSSLSFCLLHFCTNACASSRATETCQAPDDVLMRAKLL